MKRRIITALCFALTLSAAWAQKKGQSAATLQVVEEQAPATAAPTKPGKANQESRTPKQAPSEMLESAPVASEPAASAQVPMPALPKEYKSAKPVVEKVGKGKVDWTRQIVEAEGTGIINTERFKNPAQARAAAKRAAIVDAQRNLLEIVKGVDINSETTVKDLMLESDLVVTRVQGVIRGAKEVGRAREVEGAIIVTMRVPLYDENGVSSAVYEALEAKEESQPEVVPSSTPAAPVENPGSTAQTTAVPGNSLVGSGTPDEALKNVAFNILNKKLDPQLFPIIYNPDGSVALDLKKVYDPTKGEFPKWLNLSKEVMKSAGFKKGTEVIDLVQGSDGKLTIANTASSTTWKKIGNVAAKVGKFLLMLL